MTTIAYHRQYTAATPCRHHHNKKMSCCFEFWRGLIGLVSVPVDSLSTVSSFLGWYPVRAALHAATFFQRFDLVFVRLLLLKAASASVSVSCFCFQQGCLVRDKTSQLVCPNKLEKFDTADSYHTLDPGGLEIVLRTIWHFRMSIQNILNERKTLICKHFKRSPRGTSRYHALP